jgi:hypothetical protein
VNDFLHIRYPLDPAYRRLYLAVYEIVHVELKEASSQLDRERAYETLEEMEDDEWAKEDLRDYIFARRKQTVGFCAVGLRATEEILN